jgi:hypothetical protein
LVDLTDAARLVPSYSAALFSIPEIGRTSSALRTQWGWDVVLWTKDLPPRDISEAELSDELFPEMRLAYFNAWSKAAGKGVKVQVSPDAAQLLGRHVDEHEPGAPSAAPSSLISPSAPTSPTSPASPPPSPEARP